MQQFAPLKQKFKWGTDINRAQYQSSRTPNSATHKLPKHSSTIRVCIQGQVLAESTSRPPVTGCAQFCGLSCVAAKLFGNCRHLNFRLAALRAVTWQPQASRYRCAYRHLSCHPFRCKRRLQGCA